MEKLIQELIQKLQELDPEFSSDDAIRAEAMLHTVEQIYVHKLHQQEPHILKHREILLDYYESKQDALKELLTSYGLDEDQSQEILEEVFKVYSLTFIQTTEDPAVGFQNFQINVFLRTLRDSLNSNEYFDDLESAYYNIRSKIFTILNSSSEPKDRNSIQNDLDILHEYYNRAPGGDIMHELQDYEIFLKQCIWVVDGLTNLTEEQKWSFLTEISKAKTPESDKVHEMLINWLDCPAIKSQEDKIINFNNKDMSVKQAIEQTKISIVENGIDTTALELAYILNGELHVAMSMVLVDNLEILEDAQNSNLLVFAAIIRLVNKVHEEHKDSIYLGTDRAVTLLGIKSKKSFLENINYIEKKIMIALDNNISFKELSDAPSNKSKMRQ